MTSPHLRRRRVVLARLIAVAVLSIATMGLGTATASAREPTKHPATVSVPDVNTGV